jgi:hypothetical protein
MEVLPIAEDPAPFELARAPLEWHGEAEEARLELKLRAIAIPAALAISWLMNSSAALHSLIRTFVSMWIHEIGHATSAWLCGFGAFPGPWRTPSSENRMPLVSIALAGGLCFLVYRGWTLRRWWWVAGGVTLLVAQAIGTLVLHPHHARMIFSFGGDAGCLVWGSVLMMFVYVDRESSIHRGWLRWGFLVIGALSFIDVFDTWWGARTDVDRIPFGEIEGVGLSDPSVLVENYGWHEGLLISRYLTLAAVCGAAVLVAYVLGLWQAARAVRSRPR